MNSTAEVERKAGVSSATGAAGTSEAVTAVAAVLSSAITLED